MSDRLAVRLTDSLTGSLTPSDVGRWNTEAMTIRTQQAAGRRWVLPFLAALIAALAAILVGNLSPASAAATAETRVGASAVVVEAPAGPPEHISAGQRLGNEPSRVVTTVATGVAAKSADEVPAAGSKVKPTTAHGAERIAGAGATRGGVLSEDQILLVRGYGQPLTQADGAAVRVLQNEAGRFDVVVDGSRGLITSFNNLSQKSLERLATRYGWN